MTLAAGVRLGPYEIVAAIGAGGMGEVYRARDTRLGRDVAVKVLPQGDGADDPTLREPPGSSQARARDDRLRRFELEARAVAALSHPNIVALYDVGTHDGSPYLVSELLEGETLADALRGGALSVAKAVEVGIQVAKGLAAAHARRIVHRDLKPSNVFLTHDGQVKLLDFGIAKQVAAGAEDDNAPTATALDATEAGTRLGTMGYMSPEQVRGLPCDHRADMFAFGCVLYEMLSGHRAFKGATAADTMSAILKEDPPPLTDLRQSVSPALQQIVDRCLEKRAEDRFSSAHDLALALGMASTGPAPARVDTPATGTGSTGPAAVVATDAALGPVSALGRLSASVRSHRWMWLAGGLVLVLAVSAAYPFIVRQQRVAWVRNLALPKLVQLVEARDNWPAFRLAREIEAIVPGDPTVQRLRPRFAGEFKRPVQPTGAHVLARPYQGGDADWLELGKAGGKSLPAPLGHSVFKIQYPGLESREFAMSVSDFGFDSFRFSGAIVLSRPGEVPEGMVRVEVPTEQKGVDLYSDTSAFAPEPHVGSFFADAREVTNREYKRFVDADGYRRREFWTQPFERDGKKLSWDEAMALFRDTTGQPGPAGWSVGSYDQGTDDLPVTGVSWYEAAAYAAFVGKRLPSVYHWAVASAFSLGGDFMPTSNFSGKLAPVGSYRGSLNYWGLYDVAGNAREWCANASGTERFAVGGAADSSAYVFWRVDSFSPPFDRNLMTGFRCVKPVTPDARDALLDASVARKTPPDWEKEKGFSDDVWRTWQGLLPHATGPLGERTERSEALPKGTMEKVSFNAGYPGERVVAYLFLPDRKKYPPPWQAVVFLTAGFAYDYGSSEDGRNTHDASYWTWLVDTGRAVVYPIVKGTFERGGGTGQPEPMAPADFVGAAKDTFRTIDYLGTRTDIRNDRIGYLGFSSGALVGQIVCAMEPRVKTAVFLGGGIFDREMLGFARRCSIPTLIINGRDPNATGDRQSAFFKALGTPVTEKDQRTLDSDHSLAGALKTVTTLSVAWFDKYLGPVR